MQDPIVMKKDDDNRSTEVFGKFRVTRNSDLPSAKRSAFWVNYRELFFGCKGIIFP